MFERLPRMVKVRQIFDNASVRDVAQATRLQLESVLPADLNGKTIAITAGSRGIRNIALVIRTVVETLRAKGAEPFIVPAMGSHGGATAEGQTGVLESLGITEAYCGAPIRASMDVVEIGQTSCGVPVFMDRHAHGADGVILVNRIKTHTDFKGDIESGLMKMAAIGLGKHAQALQLHRQGIYGIRDVMKRVAEVVLNSGKIVCGVALVENAYDDTAHIEAIPPKRIPAREAELLLWSKRMMPKLPVEDIDLMIVDEIGKNYSGTGMDTNIIGRMRIYGEAEPESPRIKYIFVRDLSEATHGNALGIGLADLTTRRVLDKIDFQVTNENVVTSTFLQRAAIPIVMDSDYDAIHTALRCCWGTDPEAARIVHIPNTLELHHIRLSEPLLDEVQALEHVELTGGPEPFRFDDKGNLIHVWER